MIRRVARPWCDRCGVPFETDSGPDHVCGRCLLRPPAFRFARAYAYYSHGGQARQPMRTSIQNFKYRRHYGIGQQLAALAAAQFPFAAADYDRVLPVPLHVDRLRWRGFNQSVLLARRLALHYGMHLDPFILLRIRSTASQTNLSEMERRANVRGAFCLADTEGVRGKSLLLIDDVYTSGATVEECARALYAAGATVVDVYTLARAVRS